MIILIDESTFAPGSDQELISAIDRAVSAFKLGSHALAISPQAMELAGMSALSEGAQDALRLIHKNWLECQGLIAKASRVIRLTAEVESHGLTDGINFNVHNGRLEEFGILREASIVAESLRADAPYIKLLMSLYFEISPSLMKRFWLARSEAGGGGATSTFVKRYADDPTPVVILCDRDAAPDKACGPTAQLCIKEIVELNLFSTDEKAHAGGYSDVFANFGFRALGCHEMENLVLPHMAELLFRKVYADRAGRDRLEVLQRKFPNFPTLNEDEVNQWLSIDFKKMPEYPKLLSSACIATLCDWAFAKEDNFKELLSAFDADIIQPGFSEPIKHIVRDVWSIGARSGGLN